MEAILLNLLVGPLMLVLSLIFKSNPPKKINQFYGYRTKRSMKNQDTWALANSFSFDWMVKISALVTLSQIGLYFLMPKHQGILVAVGILTVGLLAVIPLTEGKLKEVFDEDGNRR